MNHLIILAVPVLMLSDYLLTILGAKASLGVYRQHFISPHYEINPLWQKSVQQLKWFSPLHFILACAVTGFLLLLVQIPDFPSEVLDFFVGVIIGAYGPVLGRHLTNLLLFRSLNRNPAEIEGQVRFTQKLMVKISLFNCLGLVPLLGLIAVLAPQPVTIGVVVGVLGIILAHLIWAGTSKRKFLVGVLIIAVTAGITSSFISYLHQNEIDVKADEWVKQVVRESGRDLTPAKTKEWLQNHGFANVTEGNQPGMLEEEHWSIKGSRQIGERRWFSPPAWVEINFRFSADKKKLLKIEYDVRRESPN
jgi:hypothetical protein